MELGECDASGRCRPVPIEGSNFMIEADAIIPAISQDVQHIEKPEIEVELSRWGTFIVDEVTMQTSVDWIFAGGDAVLGPQTAAKAAFQGSSAFSKAVTCMKAASRKRKKPRKRKISSYLRYEKRLYIPVRPFLLMNHFVNIQSLSLSL
jgi:NADPH-dependent glutamate synthase beta subunit-like oxidoreductase